MDNVTEFAKFPDSLAHLSREQPGTRQQKESGCIPEGQRNDSLFKLGAAMRHFGCNQETIESALLSHNSEMCDPPLPDYEVKSIAASGARYTPARSFSIRPKSDPKSGSLDESNSGFNPEDLGELLQKPQEEIDWLVHGYLAPRRLTAKAGPPKIGKTTAAYEAIVHVARGLPCLGRKVRQVKVLVLAVEEHSDDVIRRFQKQGVEGLEGQIKVVTGPLEFSVNVLRDIVEYVAAHDIGLVVVDTLPAWWHLENENDASEVLRSGRMLLNAIRQTKAAWLCLVHTRKSGGEGGDEIRGSSALLGLVDIAISMKRRPGDPQERVLESVSRFSQTPKELVIRYGKNGYEAMGSPAQVSVQEKTEQVLAVLDQTPRTIHEIVESTGLSKQDVSRAIDILGMQVVREGSGHKGAPFTYHLRKPIRPNSHPRGEGMDESNLELEEEVIIVD
ncbi:MAG: AAA family ATPase [Nitrospira sp.]